MFVKNPMLKMLLIGLGGANLLNKAGHEVLGKERTEGNRNAATTGREVQYRRYPDEPLNPRIVNPALQGCTLVATIDRVPCTVPAHPRYGRRLPCRSLAAEHAGQCRARPKRQAPPDGFAEL